MMGVTSVVQCATIGAAGTGSPALLLQLRWQARRPMEDAAGRLVAQHDSPPLGDALPTSLWVAGLSVQDRHAIALPPDLAPGRYTITARLYRFADGERLPVQSADLQIRDRALALAPLTVP